MHSANQTVIPKVKPTGLRSGLRRAKRLGMPKGSLRGYPTVKRLHCLKDYPMATH